MADSLRDIKTAVREWEAAERTKISEDVRLLRILGKREMLPSDSVAADLKDRAALAIEEAFR